MKRHYPNIALHVPNILLPRGDVPLESWAVVACDQHTSEPEYWQETRRRVGDNPSALHLVLPEAHLASGDAANEIAAIQRRMAEYLRSGVLVEQPPGLMLVEREVGRATPRRGLVVALDLEHYDYRAGAKTLIRCTEGTDANRLPTRVAVRRHAALETPHIMVLIDDPNRTVIEPLFNADWPVAYDFELMQSGGRLRGWHVSDEDAIDAVAEALAALRRGEPPLLYTMGDGNHSFAAARAVWEDVRERAQTNQFEALRYGLVELVNLHDDALQFEPIHRLVTGVEPAALLRAMAEHFRAEGFDARTFVDEEDWRHAWAEPSATGTHRIGYVAGSHFGLVEVLRPPARLATATLHGFLDAYLPGHAGAALDYIHGDQVLATLAADAADRIGFLLPAVDKHELFKTIRNEGATPRKTFSLGEAHEKRYYVECRRIAP